MYGQQGSELTPYVHVDTNASLASRHPSTSLLYVLVSQVGHLVHPDHGPSEFCSYYPGPTPLLTLRPPAISSASVAFNFTSTRNNAMKDSMIHLELLPDDIVLHLLMSFDIPLVLKFRQVSAAVLSLAII